MATECGIRMDTMFPCQGLSMSDCHPVQHVLHLECYNKYLATQRAWVSRCPMCRQFSLGELEWLSLSTIFNFDCDEVLEFEDMPADAQIYARAFMRGEVTYDELHARGDAILDRAAALAQE